MFPFYFLFNKKIGGRPPSVYPKEVAQAAKENLEQWLAIHLISMEAYRLLSPLDGLLELSRDEV